MCYDANEVMQAVTEVLANGTRFRRRVIAARFIGKTERDKRHSIDCMNISWNGDYTNMNGSVAVPERIHRIDALIYDLWWSWRPRPRELLRHLDYTVCRPTLRNPGSMVGRSAHDRLSHDQHYC